MYEVKWMPKTAAELEELCNKAVEHGFELVACNDNFCVFKSAQHRMHLTAFGAGLVGFLLGSGVTALYFVFFIIGGR